MTSFRKVLPKLVWTFLVRSPKDEGRRTVTFRIGHGTSSKQHNTS